MEKTDMKYPVIMEEPKVSLPLLYFAYLITHLNSAYLGDFIAELHNFWVG